MYCMTYTVLRNTEIIIEREADSAIGEPLAERRGDNKRECYADVSRKGQMVHFKVGKNDQNK